MAKKLDTFLGFRLNPSANAKHKEISEFMTMDAGVNECAKLTGKSKTEFIIDALYTEIMRLKGSSQVAPEPRPIKVETNSLPPVVAVPEVDLSDLIIPAENNPTTPDFDNTAKDALSNILSGW